MGNDLLAFLLVAAECAPDLEERREYGRIAGLLRDGKISRRACEEALRALLSRAHAWQRLLAFMNAPQEARELVEVVP